jgi:ABC-type lipoprotein release transport system permease subunit
VNSARPDSATLAELVRRRNIEPQARWLLHTVELRRRRVCFARLRGSFVGVDPLDPLTFVSVLVVTLLTASVAAAAPAWRASRIDPATAFRHDG